jgi:hypothetical protein
MGGDWLWMMKCCGTEQRWITVGSMGVECGERGLWVECHTEEFCVKVLKFEIMNSRNLFNYFSRAVPRTIEFIHSVTLSPGRFQNGPFKNR